MVVDERGCEVMVDWDRPVQTRDGRKVRVLCRDRKHSTYPVVALLEEDGEEWAEAYTRNGELHAGGVEGEGDLVNVPLERTAVVWLVRWKEDMSLSVLTVDYEDPDPPNPKHWDILARRPITIREGEGL